MEHDHESQRQMVIDRIHEVGYVDNFWAFEHYILRLSVIMNRLKGTGLAFETAFGKDMGKPRHLHKNYYYIVDPRQGKLI